MNELLKDDMVKKIKIYWELFIIFLKIGCFTFGGGLAMLPLIHNEVVEKRKLASEEEIIDIFAISQSVPGVISVNSAIFIGNKTAGITGAVAAALGLILPAFLSIILVITILTGLQGNKHVEKLFEGIKAASAALILLAAIKLGRNATKGIFGYILAVIAFLSIAVFNIHAAWVIIGCGLAGYAAYRLKGGAKDG